MSHKKAQEAQKDKCIERVKSNLLFVTFVPFVAN
jgi:hypothetical protein